MIILHFHKINILKILNLLEILQNHKNYYQEKIISYMKAKIKMKIF